MNSKQCCKIGAFGTVISGLCAFGALGMLIGFFGSAYGLALVDSYGDLVFFPSFGLFALLFVYGLLSIKRNWLTYFLSLIVLFFAVYFSRTLNGLVLILAGVAVGFALTRICDVPGIRRA